MMARPVADLAGAITQLLLPSIASCGWVPAVANAISGTPVFCVIFILFGSKATFCVASWNTCSRFAGKHGSKPGGSLVFQAGCKPTLISSAARSPPHAACARATSELKLRVKPWLRIRTTSSACHLAGRYPIALNSNGKACGFLVTYAT